MPRDGAGNFSLVSGNPVVTNTVISSTTQNNTMSDVASALTQSLSRDGQTTPTADLTMGNFKLRNLAAAIARTDAVNAGQIQDNQLVVLSSIGGTGDAITASTAPAITVYTTDAKWVYTPTNANTITNPTININGLGAKTITQSNGSGLWSGALVVGTPYELLYDGTNFRVQTGTLGSQIFPMTFSPSFRNRITDGGFRFWDFGTSFAVSATQIYTATMWLAQAGTGGAATISQQVYIPGADPAAMTSPVINYLRFAQTTNATSNPVLSCKVEHSQTMQGRSSTLSMWLWTASGTVTISSIGYNQSFGAGGSPAVLNSATVNWTVTTTPTLFSVRLDWPSITGKTIGTSDYLSINLLLPTGSTFTINTTQWQLEDCPANAPAAGLPSAFEYCGDAVETTRVRRYAQSMTTNMRQYAGAIGAVSNATISWSTPMRVAPAATLTTTGSATNLNSQALSPSTPTNGLYQIVASAVGDCSALGYVYTLDARL